MLDTNLNDFYIKEFSSFLEGILDEYAESYLHLTYGELLEMRDDIWEKLKKHEKSFAIESLVDKYECHPDPVAIYHITLERLSFISKLIYHKHFSVVYYLRNLLCEDFF